MFVYTNNSNFSTWDSIAVAVASNIIICFSVCIVSCVELTDLPESVMQYICMSELSLCRALQHEKHHGRGLTLKCQDAELKHYDISMQLQQFVTCTV